MEAVKGTKMELMAASRQSGKLQVISNTKASHKFQCKELGLTCVIELRSVTISRTTVL